MGEKKTLILGASENPERYAFLAANRLSKHNYEFVQLGNREGMVAGVPIHTEAIQFDGIDTVTLYLGPKNQVNYYQYILDLNPRRVIFNPGTWNLELVEKLKEKKIEAVEACTLVMLGAGTY